MRLTDEQRRDIARLREACEREPNSSEMLDGALRHAFRLGAESATREWDCLAREADHQMAKFMLTKEETMGTKNNPGKFDCHANALPDEPLFTLLARDPQAPALVRAWADARLSKDEAKAHEAYQCALAMEAFRRDVWMKRPKPLRPGNLVRRTRGDNESKHASVVWLQFTVDGEVVVGLLHYEQTDVIQVELSALVKSAVHEDGRPIALDNQLG